jgi:hypothetical protein
MREPSRRQEVEDAVALLSWGSRLYATSPVVSSGDVVAELAVAGGDPVAAVAARDLSAVVRTAATVTPVLQLPAQPLPARPEDGARLGSVTYRSDGLVLGTVDLLAAPVPAASAGL